MSGPRWRQRQQMRLCLVALCAALAVASCSSAPVPVLGQGYKIENIKFEGNASFSSGTLLHHLFMGEDSWVPGSAQYPFDPALVDVDTKRLADFYKARGFHHVRVLQVLPKVDADAKEANLTIRIEEGPRTRVKSLQVQWVDSDALSVEERQRLLTLAELRVDGPFDIELFHATLGDLRQALQVKGFPLASVTGSADVVEAASLADVYLVVKAGPPAAIGKIMFEGLEDVPADLLAVEVDFAPGKPYSPAIVRQVEQAVKSTRVFRWVSARTADSVTDGKVDVAVRVAEAEPQTLKLGLQLSMETVRWQEQVSADYTHVNLFGNLTRLDLHTVAGWAEMPNPWNPDLHGPVLVVEPEFSKKGILEPHLLWSLTPSYTMNLQEGYQYHSVGNRLGVSRWFGGWFSASLSHNLAWVDFFNVSPELDSSTSLLGLDFQDPYLLSYLEARAEAYFVNSINSPTDGVVLEATYDLAGGVLAGNYDYQKVLAGLRGYWKPWKRLQFALRLQTGLILPYGDDPGAPINGRFYLGGANSVRGWGARRLAPRLESCDTEGNCTHIPIGGYTMIQGNLEARLALFGPLALVAFLDLGDVQAIEKTYKTSQWNLAAGPGLRAETPLGLVRLDFGYRLNDPGVYPDEPMWGLYFGLGEAF